MRKKITEWRGEGKGGNRMEGRVRVTETEREQIQRRGVWCYGKSLVGVKRFPVARSRKTVRGYERSGLRLIALDLAGGTVSSLSVCVPGPGAGVVVVRMADFSTWVLDKAKRSLGFEDEHEQSRATWKEEEEMMDEDTANEIKAFPKSGSRSLMIAVIVDRIAVDSEDADSGSRPPSAEQKPSAEEDAKSPGDSTGEEPGDGVKDAEPLAEGTPKTEAEAQEAGSETEKAVETPEGEAPKEEGAETAEGETSKPEDGEAVPAEGESKENADGASEEADTSMEEGLGEATSHSKKKKYRYVRRIVARTVPLADLDPRWTVAFYVVKAPSSNTDADAIPSMASQYQIGVLPAVAISKLHQVILKAYLPVLDRRRGLEGEEQELILGGHHSEVISTVSKFASSLSSAVNSMTGEVNLELPDVDLEQGINFLLQDDVSMMRLRRALDSWTLT
eukprot:2216005-Rhodomonas_salina.1